MIYSCFLSPAIMKVNENMNSSCPDDVYIYIMKNSSISLMLPTLNETDIKNENK